MVRVLEVGWWWGAAVGVWDVVVRAMPLTGIVGYEQRGTADPTMLSAPRG